MRVTINEDRARHLGKVLGNIGLERIFLIEERDPQLHAITRVSGSTGSGWAAVTSSLVALVSYRLAMKGEEWWNCYGEYFSGKRGQSLREAYNRVLSFIDECKGAALQKEAKKKRVTRAYRGAFKELKILYESPERIFASGSWLLNSYAKALRQEPWRKTIAFSVKMAYYAAKSLQKNPIPAPWDVPIPIDLRVSCITFSSRLVAAHSWRDILRDPRPAIKAWEIVAGESGIPPLNIDSLLWMIGSIPRKTSIGEARLLVERKLRPVIGFAAGRLANELIRGTCA